MPETNLALQIIDKTDDFSNVFIGHSCFIDDVWDLKPFMPVKTLSDRIKRIDFGYILNEDMKMVTKQYAYYRLGQIKPYTVIQEINSSLPKFFEYCVGNGINSFKHFTKEDYLNFSYWMKDVKCVSVSTGAHCAYAVENIIKTGQIKGWNVTQKNIFNDITTGDLWSRNRSETTTKPIPGYIFDKILYHVVQDEKNILTKAGIIIQSQTGLRISEVLSISEGCIKETVINGTAYDYMEVTLGKTEKGELINHKVFINDLVKSAIKELSEFTATLRKESGMKELFLIHGWGKTIRAVNSIQWNSNRLLSFMKRWNIRDNKGYLYPLKSHQFRMTFVRELVKQKVPISYIMKQYAHVSIEMTAHYLTLQEDEIKEMYSDMILSPDSKIAGIRAKEIRGKLDKIYRGKTEDEIGKVISELSDSMGFNPLPTGVCLYDFRRGNCTDGDGCFVYNCPNFITEARFYPVLKAELDLIEKEMSRLKSLGQEPARQVQYIKWKYLKPLVESLEVQKNGD